VDFNKEVTLNDIMAAMATTGFQATETSRAIDGPLLLLTVVHTRKPPPPTSS
jgi:hypothetical protein